MAADRLLTDRLLLTDLSIQDARELFVVRGDTEAMAYWDWPPDPSPEVTAAIVSDILHEVSTGRAHCWTMRLRADKAFAGVCDVSELRGDGSGDLGFMVARRYWGQGLGQEAVARVLEYAREIGVQRLSARVHDGNQRSMKLLTRLGFTEARPLSAFEIRPGVFRDCRFYEKRL